MAFRIRLVVIVLAMIAGIQPTASARELETVSPGAPDRIAEIEGRCPIFIWEAVPEAAFFELVAYRLPDGLTPEDLTDEVLAEAGEALKARVAGRAAGWTPDLADGLVRGATYVWFLRAVYREDRGEVIEAGEWSQERFFSISTPPASAEVEEALRVLRRDAQQTADSEDVEARRGDAHKPAGTALRGLAGSPKSVSTAKTAIRGNVPDASGETYGVVGISNSPNGAGLAAGNTNGGADLVLDGLLDGDADTVFTQAGIDRAATGELWFSLINSDTGVLSLSVEGQIVGDGSGLTAVDADTLDGSDGAAFATEVELAASGSAAVHWDNLTTVPTGLDDGDDDTTYSAGAGLTLSATEFSAQGSVYDNVVIVAKSGGDFTEVQAAIDSISDASAGNPYLVWVAPGVYSEEVTMKPHVHMQGAGQEGTVITSIASSSSWWFPDAATLVLASDTSLRDLTVGNSGTGTYSVALMATAGTTGTLVADVSARAQGGGIDQRAIFVTGGSTEVTLHDVTALSEGGSSSNFGLSNTGSSTVTLHGGSYTGRGGSVASGINNEGSGTITVASGVTALADGGSSDNFGLNNLTAATATLHGGSYTGRGGSVASGIVTGIGTTLEADAVTALGDGGSSDNYGLINGGGATARLHGGSFTGRGGVDTFGIYNSDILGTTLEATAVTALGDGGSSHNHGLVISSGPTVTLHDGSFTGRGGVDTFGISNEGNGSTLEATAVAALGEGGSTGNFGLTNQSSASATVTQSALEGTTYSVANDGSTVTISNSRLVGGAVYNNAGTATCVLVTRGTTVSTDGSTCP